MLSDEKPEVRNGSLPQVIILECLFTVLAIDFRVVIGEAIVTIKAMDIIGILLQLLFNPLLHQLQCLPLITFQKEFNNPLLILLICHGIVFLIQSHEIISLAEASSKKHVQGVYWYGLEKIIPKYLLAVFSIDFWMVIAKAALSIHSSYEIGVLL